MKTQLIFRLTGWLLALAVVSRANTITPMTVTFLPGVSITYSANLTSGELVFGDGFTIFDLFGVTGAGVTPLNWTRTDQAVGSAISGPNVLAPLGFDSALTNVTYIYGGSSVEMAFTPLNLGSFLINTTGTTMATDDWVSRDHLLGNQGVIDGAFGPGDRAGILVPAQSPAGPANVPEGGNTLLLLGVALSGLGFLRRRLADN